MWFHDLWLGLWSLTQATEEELALCSCSSFFHLCLSHVLILLLLNTDFSSYKCRKHKILLQDAVNLYTAILL